jgi:hypothetical protein
MPATDLGYAPRYFGFLLAWSFSRFDGESTLPPQAGTPQKACGAGRQPLGGLLHNLM